MELGEAALGHFDFLWASPVCTEYSRALTKRPEAPWWAFENLQTGLLKTRPFVQGLPYSDVCYCKYGFRYKKATRIWHNLPWRPAETMCRKDDRCEAFADGIHPEAAQRGTTNGRRNQQSREQLYSMPPRLCDEIAAAVS